MHQHKQPHQITIRPLDVIYYTNGGKPEQAVVLSTEPAIGAGKIIRDELGHIKRIGMIATIPHNMIEAVHSLLPIQTIHDALAYQYGVLDMKNAQETILAALLHKEVIVEPEY